MDWEAFHPYVEPLVRGCPQPTIDHAVREAAIEFCNRALVWYDTRVLSARATVGEYNLPHPADSEVTQVLRIAPAGRAPLIGLRELELDAITDWETATAVESTHYLFTQPSRVKLYPIPENAMTLRVRAAYRPSFDAGEVQDFIFESWRDCIVAGALAWLKELPGQQWTDPLGAARAAAKFSAYASKAKGDQERGYHKGSLSVRMNRFC